MATTYAFDDFIVDPQRRMLARRSGEMIKISPKAFDALAYLVQHAGGVVSRVTLSDALWPEAVVVDNGLSQVIRALRLALEDALPPHRYVVTVPRRGYQFVADVFERSAREKVATPIVPSVTIPSDFGAPRTDSMAYGRTHAVLAVACTLAAALLILTVFRSQPASTAQVPDRAIPATASAWPLPPVVACQRLAAGSMSPPCKRILIAAKERERRWKLGLGAT